MLKTYEMGCKGIISGHQCNLCVSEMKNPGVYIFRAPGSPKTRSEQAPHNQVWADVGSKFFGLVQEIFSLNSIFQVQK